MQALTFRLSLILTLFAAASPAGTFDITSTLLGVNVYEGGVGFGGTQVLSSSINDASEVSLSGTTPGGWSVDATGRIEGLAAGGPLYTADSPVSFVLTDVTVACAFPGVGCDDQLRLSFFALADFENNPYPSFFSNFHLAGSVTPDAEPDPSVEFAFELYSLIPTIFPPTFVFEFDQKFASGGGPIGGTTFEFNPPNEFGGSPGPFLATQSVGAFDFTGHLLLDIGANQTLVLPDSLRADLNGVPEPGSLVLLVSGFAALALFRRQRNRTD